MTGRIYSPSVKDIAEFEKAAPGFLRRADTMIRATWNTRKLRRLCRKLPDERDRQLAERYLDNIDDLADDLQAEWHYRTLSAMQKL